MVWLWGLGAEESREGGVMRTNPLLRCSSRTWPGLSTTGTGCWRACAGKGAVPRMPRKWTCSGRRGLPSAAPMPPRQNCASARRRCTAASRRLHHCATRWTRSSRKSRDWYGSTRSCCSARSGSWSGPKPSGGGAGAAFRCTSLSPRSRTKTMIGRRRKMRMQWQARREGSHEALATNRPELESDQVLH